MSLGKIRRILDYRSIRFRLTALFVVLLATTLIIFSSILYSALMRTFQRDFDIDLFNHTVDVAQGIQINFFGELSLRGDLLSSGGKIVPFSIGSTFVQVISPEGKVLARSQTLKTGNLPFSKEDSMTLLQRGVALRTIRGREIFSETPLVPGANLRTNYRLISYLAADRPLGASAFILQIAVPMTLLEQSARGLRTFLIIGIPIALVIGTFLGFYFSSRALKPVDDIIAKAKQLSPFQLSERIPVPPVDDELRRLSLTLNELLSRLQQAFESQERFIADASHELKTPLAILRGELDVLKSRPRSEVETTEFLTSASQELDFLARVVEDLLLLARVDAGSGSLAVDLCRLDEAALEICSRLESLAKAKGTKIRFEIAGGRSTEELNFEAFEVRGDEDLLKVMMKNLVENAIKFSPIGGTVHVTLKDTGKSLRFSVKDEGPGVPPELQQKIFDRFFRVPSESNQKAPGAGLGLAIASRIAQAHHSSISLNSSQDTEGHGTEFAVEIKKL